MKIGYCKIGRSWKLDPLKGVTGSGDVDVARALHLLSRMRPNDEFILVGANDGSDPQKHGYPDNVKNPWMQLRGQTTGRGMTIPQTVEMLHEKTWPYFSDLDAIVNWAGQHGTSNLPIPSVGDRSTVTQPQISFVKYGSYILNGINRWRDDSPRSREEIWLCPDVRNYVKCRDLKWPLQLPVIAQYDQTRPSKHERFGDQTPPETYGAVWDPKNGDDRGSWLTKTRYTYDALEMTALPSPAKTPLGAWPSWESRHFPLGMLVNENRAYVSVSRLNALTEWVLPNWPQAEVFGVWSDKSKAELGREDIRPCPYEHMPTVVQRWFTTLTTPASGSGWATAKPWEAFAHGTVCFFHPKYDNQDHVLRDAPLAMKDWLRVKTPDELRKRVEHLTQNKAAWEWLVEQQWQHYARRYEEAAGGVAAIMRRLG